jgi:hypothetical protein
VLEVDEEEGVAEDDLSNGGILRVKVKVPVVAVLALFEEGVSRVLLLAAEQVSGFVKQF